MSDTFIYSGQNLPPGGTVGQVLTKVGGPNYYTAWRTPSTDTGNTTNSITFNSSGIGGSPGSTFNGSSALTVSYNTIGAQPLDATLTALAAVTTTANSFIYATASDTFTTSTVTSYARSLLDDVDAVTARTTLGLGTIATQDSNNVSITGGSIDGIVFDDGTY